MGLTPEQMGEAIIANLSKKTGKTLQEWIETVKSAGPENQKDRIEWLKREYNLGSVTAETVVFEAEKPEDYVAPALEDFVNAQYSGPKAVLRPIYDLVIQKAQKLGPDVKVSPCKTYMALMRRRQVAIVKASTLTRVDIGLALPGVETTTRLQAAARALGGSDRITHRVALTSTDDIDAELLIWLKAAYDADG